MKFASVLIALSCWSASPCCIAAKPNFQTIALTGQQVTSLPEGLHHSMLMQTLLNDSGQIAFQSALSYDSYSYENPRAVWLVDPDDSIKLIARSHELTEEYTGPLLSSIHLLSLNNTGQLMLGNGDYTASGPYSLWQTTPDPNIQEIIGRNSPAPGPTPNTRFLGFHDSRQGENSQISFLAGTIDYNVSTDVDSGLWTYSPQQGLKFVLHRGDQVPHAPAGTMWGNVAKHSFNSRGTIGFMAYLFGPAINDDEMGIWSIKAGKEPRLVARLGDHAPGLDPGVTFGDFDPYAQIVFNNRDEVAFFAGLNGRNINGKTRGLWVGSSQETLRMVARMGDPAPDASPDTKFYHFLHFALNDFGKVSFLGQISGSTITPENYHGIWSETTDGQLSLVARQGSPAPGGGAFSQFEMHGINNLGQTAFLASLSGPDIAPNSYGIWAQDLQGVLKLVVRTGDLFDVDQGPGFDYRVVQDLSYVSSAHNNGGIPRTFNNRGQIVFQASFTDGSQGIFLSNLVAVPEPTTIVLLLVGFVILSQPRSSESTNRTAACRALASPAR